MRIRQAAIAACALLASSATAHADTPATLFRVDRAEYRVDRVQASLEDAGVTHALLDSMVAATLAASGIPAEATKEDVADGLLSLQTTYLINSGWHIASLSLSFFRKTTLAAEPTVAVTAAVWTRGGIVVARKKKLWKEVSSSLEGLLGEFVDEYRAAARYR